MVISENGAFRGHVPELVVTNGAVVEFEGTVDGDLTVDGGATLSFGGCLLGKLVIEQGCRVSIRGIACEDNLPTDVDFDNSARLVPSGYLIVKCLD